MKFESTIWKCFENYRLTIGRYKNDCEQIITAVCTFNLAVFHYYPVYKIMYLYLSPKAKTFI